MAKTDTKTKQNKSPLDPIWLLLATAVIVAGIYGYYHFEEMASTPVRTGLTLLVIGIGVLIFGQSSQGRSMFRFVKEADIERRKVVWPTRTETIQTTIMVIVVTIIIALLLWGIDSVLQVILQWLI